MPNKYKVEFTRTEVYCIDVLAENEADATKQAETKLAEVFENGTYHYFESEDATTEVKTIYDVTGTDDPFSP